MWEWGQDTRDAGYLPGSATDERRRARSRIDAQGHGEISQFG